MATTSTAWGEVFYHLKGAVNELGEASELIGRADDEPSLAEVRYTEWLSSLARLLDGFAEWANEFRKTTG